jgi:hypothetical protein
MRFVRADYPPDNASYKNVCYLINDNWDDYRFKTSFSSILFDRHGQRHELGGIKILPKGWEKGRVPVPALFNELDKTWCSLGNARANASAAIESDISITNTGSTPRMKGVYSLIRGRRSTSAMPLIAARKRTSRDFRVGP